jgi:hypothetical protein
LVLARDKKSFYGRLAVVKKLLLLLSCAALTSCAELNQLLQSVTGTEQAQLELSIKGATKTTSKVSFSGPESFFYTDDGRSFTIGKSVRVGTYRVEPEPVNSFDAYVQFNTPNGNQSVIGPITITFEVGKTYKIAVEYVKQTTPTI